MFRIHGEKDMNTNTKMLIFCTSALLFCIIMFLIRFTIGSFVSMLVPAILTSKYTREFLDDHRINTVSIGFIKNENGETRVKIIEQGHYLDFKKEDKTDSMIKSEEKCEPDDKKE